MTNCLFCKISLGELPCNKVYEDNDFLVFHDLHPKAPIHVLVVPKRHIQSLAHLEEHDQSLMGKLTLLLQKIALTLNLTAGFRTIVNTGKGGGQEVFHLHYHLLGTPS